jgi:tetratricopeptide (TPR) repeat protein
LRYFEKSKRNNYFFLSAQESFKKALERKPLFPEALFNLACLSYNREDYKKAADYFGRALAMIPEDERTKLYARCAQEKLDQASNQESSLDCPADLKLSREIVDNPDREYKHPLINDKRLVIENINFLGLESIRNGKLHDAIRIFRNGLKISPESSEMHFNLGMVFYWLNYLKDAETYALLALRKRGFFGRMPAPRKQEILRDRGREMYDELEVPLSEWTFEVALEKGNYFSDAFDFLGNIYFRRQDFEKSIRAYKKVIDIYPEDAIGYYNLGCAYWALDEKDSAESAWKNAIKYEHIAKEREARAKISDDQLTVSLLVLRRPVAYKAHKSLGRLYLERDWRDKALDEFEKAIELDPSDPEPYFELGKMYQTKDEVQKAISYFEKYLYLGGRNESEVSQILKSLKKKNDM